MKKIILLFILLTIINPISTSTPYLHQPKPMRAHQLYMQRHTSQLPIDLITRPGTPRPRTPHDRCNNHAIDFPLGSMSPQEVHVEEVRAHAQEVRALSKKKIACLVAASAITSAVLTAAVTLTIHFTECGK